jgi:hypothetical protein
MLARFVVMRTFSVVSCKPACQRFLTKNLDIVCLNSRSYSVSKIESQISIITDKKIFVLSLSL